MQMVLVVCGPYTTADSITYDPMLDLIDVINKDKPDVCILVRDGFGVSPHVELRGGVRYGALRSNGRAGAPHLHPGGLGLHPLPAISA